MNAKKTATGLCELLVSLAANKIVSGYYGQKKTTTEAPQRIPFEVKRTQESMFMFKNEIYSCYTCVTSINTPKFGRKSGR